MTPPETTAIATELAQFRNDFGQFGRDVAEIKTACAVLVERSNRVEQDVRDLRQDTDKEITELRQEKDKDVGDLRADVETLKRRVWTASGGAIVLGAVAGYVVQFAA